MIPKIKNEPLKDHIDYSPGDYKILVENKIFPKDENVGYILSARTYLDYEKEKKIDGMNLASFFKEIFMSYMRRL